MGVTKLYAANQLATAISFIAITPPNFVIVVLTVILLIELRKVRIAGASQTTQMAQIQLNCSSHGEEIMLFCYIINSQIMENDNRLLT